LGERRGGEDREIGGMRGVEKGGWEKSRSLPLCFSHLFLSSAPPYLPITSS